MKITYVCNEYPPRPHGGIGVFYQRCARAMRRAGHEISVVGIGDENASRTDDGVEVHTLKRSLVRPLGQYINRWKIYNWLRRHVATRAIDIVEVPDFQGYLPLNLPRTTVVVRLHMTETVLLGSTGRRARPLFRLFERLTLARHGNWIACSESVLTRTVRTFGINPDRANVIYSAVPLTEPGRIPTDIPAQYILCAGTVSPRKGVLDVAEAFAQLCDGYPDLHLVFAGPVIRSAGVNTDEEIRRVAGAAAASRIIFTSRIPHSAVLSLMARARAFVFPSTVEAFPLVVIEAMSMASPVIACNTPPFSEIIRDGHSGLLDELNSPKKLAEAVACILDDPARAERLAAKGRETVETHCSEERFVLANVEFYDRVRGITVPGAALEPAMSFRPSS